jgi:ubiquinone/menaquinone biosynthesis C-methylase UbiE
MCSLHPRFDDDYLYFFEQTHHDDRNRRQSEFILEALNLQSGERVLDVPCGYGRIANRLAAKGIEVVGVDAQTAYVNRAKETASDQLLQGINYEVGDMRDLRWHAEFDALICWYISLGYYDDATDEVILRQFRKVLKPGGRLLIEHINLSGYLRSLPSRGLQYGISERDSSVMILEASFDLETSRNIVNRRVYRDGNVRECRFSVRCYSLTEINKMLECAGFSNIRVTNRENAALSLNDDRMFVYAEAE